MNLMAFGEFRLREGKERYEVGEIVSTSLVKDLVRTEQKRCNPLFESERVEANSKKFIFQNQKLGYHYGWVANKHLSNLEHSFCVYLFCQQMDNIDQLQCIGVFHSSSFTIFCRRRHLTVSPKDRNRLAKPLKEYIESHDLNNDGLLGRPNETKSNANKRLKIEMIEITKTSDKQEKNINDKMDPSREHLSPQSVVEILPFGMSYPCTFFQDLTETSSICDKVDLSWLLPRLSLETNDRYSHEFLDIDDDDDLLLRDLLFETDDILTFRQHLKQDSSLSQEILSSLDGDCFDTFLDCLQKGWKEWKSCKTLVDGRSSSELSEEVKCSLQEFKILKQSFDSLKDERLFSVCSSSSETFSSFEDISSPSSTPKYDELIFENL